ncbi:MAG TPA: MFS transporter [Candidatus Acidoferrales bacterium]|nr:MFS transporter [Candidatus Acidoferrales bacterium]
MAKKPRFYGWKLVAVLSSLDFLNLGLPVYGGTVINSYMLREIPMSRSMLGLGFTLLNLFVGLPATIVAISILKRGIRATYLIGSALICLGSLFLAFFATKPWHYLLGFGAINGIGVCFGDIVPGTTAVARWFKRYRGRATAVVLSGSGISGFLAAPFMDRLIRVGGGNWRLGWEIIAAVAIVGGILAAVFIKERPEDLGQFPDGNAEEDNPAGPGRSQAVRESDELITRHVWTPSEAYRTRAYWLIVLGGLASQFPFFFFTAHWILHLQGAGIASSDAAFAMGLFTISCIAGRLIGGWLMDTMTARYAFMIGLCCYVGGSLAALRVGPDSLTIAYSGAVLYGLGIGWTFTCMTTCVAHFFGPAAFPKLAGMLILLTSGGASPAGLIGGRIFDVYGSYTRAFELNILIAAVGIIAMAFATLPRPRDARAAVAQAA